MPLAVLAFVAASTGADVATASPRRALSLHNQCHRVTTSVRCGSRTTSICPAGYEITTREECEEAARDLRVGQDADSAQPLTSQSYNDPPGTPSWGGTAAPFFPGCFTRSDLDPDGDGLYTNMWWNTYVTSARTHASTRACAHTHSQRLHHYPPYKRSLMQTISQQGE